MVLYFYGIACCLVAESNRLRRFIFHFFWKGYGHLARYAALLPQTKAHFMVVVFAKGSHQRALSRNRYSRFDGRPFSVFVFRPRSHKRQPRLPTLYRKRLINFFRRLPNAHPLAP